MSSADDELSDLRRTFYEEAEERLVDVEGLLLELEQSPRDLELLNAIFRAVHSIKGGSGACELFELARFAHAMESLLSPLRKGELSVNARLLDVLLHANDVLNALVDAAKRNQAGDALAIEHALEAIHAELTPLPGQDEPSGLSATELSAGFAIWSDPPPASTDQTLLAPPKHEDDDAFVRAPYEPAASESWLEPEPHPTPRPASTAPGDLQNEAREPVRFSPASPDAPTLHDDEGAAPTADANAHAEVSQPGEVADDAICFVDTGLSELPSASECAVCIEDTLFSQLLDLTTDIAGCSAQLHHTLETASAAVFQDTNKLAASLDCLQQLASHLGEFEARLTGMRGGGHSSLLDGVVVRAASALYVLPTSTVESYLELRARDVRRLPTGDSVLITSSGVLRLMTLAELVTYAVTRSKPEPSIAVIIKSGRERSALLVDAVLTQGKLLVRPLEQNFRRVPGIMGATPFGTTLALVLDLAHLLQARRSSVHSIHTR